MAKYERRLNADFREVVRAIDEGIPEFGISMELVDSSDFTVGGSQVAVRVFDKYFQRNQSRASLSVTVAGTGRDIYVSAIGAGGGTGVFLRFNWGSETELSDYVRQILDEFQL